MLINILTFNLPGAITRPLFTEYNNRIKEIDKILGWENSAYKELREYESVVESLLAMSFMSTAFFDLFDTSSKKEYACLFSISDLLLNQDTF